MLLFVDTADKRLSPEASVCRLKFSNIAVWKGSYLSASLIQLYNIKPNLELKMKQQAAQKVGNYLPVYQKTCNFDRHNNKSVFFQYPQA